MLEEKDLSILKKLISDVEGAPYPSVINNELYTIWYEHVQISASAALEFLDTMYPEDRARMDDIDF